MRKLTALGLAAIGALMPATSARANHDYFLQGEPAGVSAWPITGEAENHFSQSPALKIRQELIVAMYLAPLLLEQGKTEDAAALLPAQTKSPLDSLSFLQWRLELANGKRDKKVVAQAADFLKRFNQKASKNNGVSYGDLASLSREYLRRERLLDSDNLAYVASRVKVAAAVEVSAREKSLLAQKEYEQALAEAYQFTLLDQVDSASAKFEKVASYLRSRGMQERPQSDSVRAEAQRVLDVQLAPFEVADKKLDESGADLKALKTVLGRQIDLAYLAKVDGRLHEAGYQFRRAYALVQKYMPGTSDYSYLTYDLAETLLWDEKFEESVYYFQKCLAERLAADAKSTMAVDTRNMLGRAYLRQGASKKGLDCFFHNLRAVGGRDGTTLPETDADLPEALVNNIKSDEARRLVDDALQGISDATVPLKQYNLGISAGKQLLALRAAAPTKNKDALMGSLWALAYACDSNAMPTEASQYFSRLIDDYAESMPALAPAWYHGRGLDFDQLGDHKRASVDLKQAIKLYQKRLDKDAKQVTDQSGMDEETRDRLTWTVADLKYNLDLAHEYSPLHDNYAELPANNMWRLKSFPLKVYIGESGSAGFGGEILSTVHSAVGAWTTFADSPLSVKYVDNLEDADIFIERVSSYDDIPYSSAGRTSANFERSADYLEQPQAKLDKTRQIMTKAHVRVYCPSFDGSKWEGQDVAMSPEALAQFKTLITHEVGHAFGLDHSPAGPDMMFWKTCAKKLSPRDMLSIIRLYRIAKS